MSNPIVEQRHRDAAADFWRDFVAKTGEVLAEKAIRCGGMDDSDIVQRFVRLMPPERDLTRPAPTELRENFREALREARQWVGGTGDEDMLRKIDTALYAPLLPEARDNGQAGVDKRDLLLLKALLCLSGFAGEGLHMPGFADPADLYGEIAAAIGMEDADDDDLRAHIEIEERRTPAPATPQVSDTREKQGIAPWLAEVFERSRPFYDALPAPIRNARTVDDLAALQSTPDTRAKIVAFIRRRASEIVNGLSTGVGAHDPIWTVSAYMHGLANDIAGEDGALTPMPDTRAIVAETVERCWRAAWAAEPLPEAPVSLQDRPLFNYGRDCAVAAIRASAAPEEGK